MLIGILTGTLVPLLLYLLAVRALLDVCDVEPHPSAGGMYWLCLLLPLAAVAVVAAVTMWLRPRARPAFGAFLSTFLIVGAGMAALQHFADTFADRL